MSTKDIALKKRTNSCSDVAGILSEETGHNDQVSTVISVSLAK